MWAGRLEGKSTKMRPAISPSHWSLKALKFLTVLILLFISHMVLNAGAVTGNSSNPLLSRTVTIGSSFEIDVSRIQVFTEFKEKPIVTAYMGSKWKRLNVLNSQKEFNDGVKKLICEVAKRLEGGYLNCHPEH